MPIPVVALDLMPFFRPPRPQVVDDPDLPVFFYVETGGSRFFYVNISKLVNPTTGLIATDAVDVSTIVGPPGPDGPAGPAGPIGPVWLGDIPFYFDMTLEEAGTVETETLHPTGDGTYTEMNEKISDDPTHWETVRFAGGGFVMDNRWGPIVSRDTYTFDPTDAVSVAAVTVSVRCATLSPPLPAKIALMIRTHDTDYSTDIEYITATTFDDPTVVTHTWDTNPFTDLPWTVDEVNALEAGWFYQSEGGMDGALAVDEIHVDVSTEVDGQGVPQDLVTFAGFQATHLSLDASATCRIAFDADAGPDTLLVNTDHVERICNGLERVSFTNNGLGKPHLWGVLWCRMVP